MVAYASSRVCILPSNFSKAFPRLLTASSMASSFSSFLRISWAVGQSLAPGKKQKITETAISQVLISNGEAVAVDGGTTGHTMTSMGESLREAQRPTRSLATPKSRMRSNGVATQGKEESGAT